MSTINVNLMADNQGGSVAPISSVMRNRIINGAQTIDQRGSAGTPVQTGYATDRWAMVAVVGGKISLGQSSVAPSGFTNSLLTTSLSSYTLTANDTYGFQQPIEGFNIADLGWGTALAQSVTISFWVRSSLTGSFGGAVINSASNRSYTFNYTINSANTFEYKTVTILGDTTGTWLTNNGIGIALRFGVGSTGIYTQAAGSWGTANAVQPAGNVSLVGTNGATFYITGVQLERGTQATSFEYRQYGTELALCQRYFYWNGGVNDISFFNINSTNVGGAAKFPAQMRAVPTIAIYNSTTLNQVSLIGGGTGTFGAITGVSNSSLSAFNGTSLTGLGGVQFNYSASSEL
jgi:hypothetical protein